MEFKFGILHGNLAAKSHAKITPMILIQNVNRPATPRGATEIQMNGEYSQWLIGIPTESAPLFNEALSRVKENTDLKERSLRIDHTFLVHYYDVILTEDELLVLRLSMPSLSYSWVKDWVHAKL